MASPLPDMLKTLVYSGILGLASELPLPGHSHQAREWDGASDVD